MAATTARSDLGETLLLNGHPLLSAASVPAQEDAKGGGGLAERDGKRRGRSDRDEGRAGNVSTLAHLVDTDLKAAIRLILDRGWTDSYTGLLGDHVANQQEGIRRLCGEHYQDFVSSVESLVNVKYDITNLKQKIHAYNALVQQSGKTVISTVEKLVPQRHVRQRIEQAIEVLQNCAQRIDSLRIAQMQIENKHYVQALGTLDRLAQVPHYNSRIAQLIGTVIKHLKAKVKSCVRAEYNQWLKKLPKISMEVGMILLTKSREQIKRSRMLDPQDAFRSHSDIEARKRQAISNPHGDMLKISKLDTSLEANQSFLSPGDARSPVSTISESTASTNARSPTAESKRRKGIELLLSNGLNEEQASKLLEVQDSLGTVFQSVHINQLLTKEDFEGLKRYSQIQRNRIAKTLWQAVPNSVTRLFKDKERYFGALLGFFAIQVAIIRSPLGGLLLSLEDCHKLWVSKVCKEIENTAKQLFTSLKSPDSWTKLRAFTTEFVHALKSIGLPTTPLKAFTGSKGDEYVSLLKQTLDMTVDKILENDQFSPLTLKSEGKYKEYIVDHGLQDRSRHTSFPVTLPFSKSVPLICQAVASVMEDYFAFKLSEEPVSGRHASGKDSKQRSSESKSGSGQGVAEIDDPYQSLVDLVDKVLGETVIARLRPQAMMRRGHESKRRMSQMSGQVFNPASSSELQPSQQCQLLINCNALANACDRFEERAYRMVEEGYPRYPPPSIKAVLKSKGEFENIKMQYNSMILEGIGHRIDQLLDLSEMNWKAVKLHTQPWPAFEDLTMMLGLAPFISLRTALSLRKDCGTNGDKLLSDSILVEINSIIASFESNMLPANIWPLQATFSLLTQLPAGLREGAHLHAVNHISISIRSFWRLELRAFTVVGMANFAISLKVLEDFAKQYSNVPGVTEALGDLRQITDLILKERDVLKVADRKYREGKYKRVQPDLLCELLLKYNGLGMFNRVPASLPNHSKRHIEQVVKSIRGGRMH